MHGQKTVQMTAKEGATLNRNDKNVPLPHLVRHTRVFVLNFFDVARLQKCENKEKIGNGQVSRGIKHPSPNAFHETRQLQALGKRRLHINLREQASPIEQPQVFFFLVKDDRKEHQEGGEIQQA